MKLRLLIIAIIFFHANNVFSQKDHLLPMEGIFGIFDFQVEYYSEVRKFLFEGLEEVPSFRIIVLPSFSQECMVTSKRKGDKNYLLFRRTNKSIWYTMEDEKSKLKTIKTIDFEIEIDSTTNELFFELFNTVLENTKYSETDMMGLDGTTYIFQTFKFREGKRSGYTWSPNEKTKLGRLVKIVEMLAEYAQEKKNRHLALIKKEVETLIKELKKKKN